jgi:hypothetical protein
VIEAREMSATYLISIQRVHICVIYGFEIWLGGGIMPFSFCRGALSVCSQLVALDRGITESDHKFCGRVPNTTSFVVLLME